jgi:hypothetical protein
LKKSCQKKGCQKVVKKVVKIVAPGKKTKILKRVGEEEGGEGDL